MFMILIYYLVLNINSICFCEKFDYLVQSLNEKTKFDLQNLEDEIDSFVQNGTDTSSYYSRANRIDSLHFHSNECTITTWDTKMYLKENNLHWHTDLSRRIVLFDMNPQHISVEGDFKIDRLAYGDIASRAVGAFRTTITDLNCEGLAAVDAGNLGFILDWLHLYCNLSESKIKTEVREFGIISGNTITTFINENFVEILEERLENELVTTLEEITSEWMKRKLASLPASIKENQVLRNSNYTNSCRIETMSANDIIDGLLVIVATQITENYNDVLPIPDIKEGFEKNVLHLVKVGAIFQASDGNARGVSTINRIGDARLRQVNDTIYFSGSVGFKKLLIAYGRYRAEVLGIGPGGSISTSVVPVVIHLRLRINFVTRRIMLDHLSISQVRKIQVRVKGMGWFLDRFVSTITNWVVAIFKDQILQLIGERITKYTRETLSKKTIDDIIAGGTSIK